LAETIRHIRTARVYNQIVGSNITHFDVSEWGWVDEMLIINAINYISDEMKTAG
jgi:hypothetical protein